MTLLLLLVVVSFGLAMVTQRDRWCPAAKEACMSLYPRCGLPARRLPRVLLKAAEGTRIIGVSGSCRLPDMVDIEVHPDDLGQLLGTLDWLSGDITNALRKRAQSRNWTVPSGFTVRIVSDSNRPIGLPIARARMFGPVRMKSVAADAAKRAEGDRWTVGLDGAGMGEFIGWERESTEFAGDDDTEHVDMVEVRVDQGAPQVHAVTSDGLVVGRADRCDVQLPTVRASREHVLITVNAGCVMVEDLGSRNGTRIGRRRIAKAESLGAGGTVEAGGSLIHVKVKA